MEKLEKKNSQIEEVPSESSPGLMQEMQIRQMTILEHIKGVIEKNLDPHYLFEALLIFGPMVIFRSVSKVVQDVFDKYYKKFLEHLSSHPIQTLLIFGLVLFVGIPILSFVLLAIITTMITFSGFLVIEGTLIVIGALISGACILPILGFVFMAVFNVAILMFILQKLRLK